MKTRLKTALSAALMLVAVPWMPTAHAQRKPSVQPPTIAEQARGRARIPAAPLNPVRSETADAPVRSIFQAEPAQLSTSRRPVVGERRTAASLIPANGPLERVDGRIDTRVQSRILGRLDKSGEAQPALSPFATAADRARVASLRRR